MFFDTPEIRPLHIDQLRRDGNTQCRVRANESTIQQFAQLMQDGTTFPPVRVWFDGAAYWLSNGFHRIAAAERAGIRAFPAEILEGTLEDAIWDSCGANATHGMRRMRSDVEIAVQRALNHPNARSLSNVAIAKHLGLPEPTLRRWRRRLAPQEDQTRRVVLRNGRSFSMDVTAIGKPHARTRRGGGRARTRICGELESLRAEASPEVRSVINVFLNWASGGSDNGRFLQVLEQICQRWRGPAVKQPDSA